MQSAGISWNTYDAQYFIHLADHDAFLCGDLLHLVILLLLSGEWPGEDVRPLVIVSACLIIISGAAVLVEYLDRGGRNPVHIIADPIMAYFNMEIGEIDF